MDQLSPYLPGVLLAYATFFVGLASPGPNILAVLGTSMSVGRRSGLALALGVAAGSFCWAMLSVVGLSALIASYAAALRVIKVAGGLYLLWLAYKTFRSALSTQDLEARTLAGSARAPQLYSPRTDHSDDESEGRAHMDCDHVIRPSGRRPPVGARVTRCWDIRAVRGHPCLYAMAFSTPLMVRFYAKARRSIQATLGALFAVAGLKLLASRS